VLKASSLDEALQLANRQVVFVIGGAQLYDSAIKHSMCGKVYLTRIHSKFECDTFFPQEHLLANYTLSSKSELQSEKGFNFNYEVYTSNN
jgi:dihydrofolate reductase